MTMQAFLIDFVPAFIISLPLGFSLSLAIALLLILPKKEKP